MKTMRNFLAARLNRFYLAREYVWHLAILTCMRFNGMVRKTLDGIDFYLCNPKLLPPEELAYKKSTIRGIYTSK